MGERVPVYSDVFEDIDADEVKRYDFKHKTDSIMKCSFFFSFGNVSSDIILQHTVYARNEAI